MIKVGDKVIFDSEVDPDDAHLNGSIVKVLSIEDYVQKQLESEDDDIYALIEFDDGITMDVEVHELKEIEGE